MKLNPKIKIIIFITLGIAIITPIFMNFRSSYQNVITPLISAPPTNNELIIGFMYGPDELDVQEMWESAGFQVALNVYEALFTNNLSSPGLELVPQLAADFGTWSLGATDQDPANYTVTLRQGVTFHDGGKFNASAVKWTFDRLDYWTNASGLLPSNETEAKITVLYQWPDGTPIINTTEIIDEYTIKFVLNRPYGAFEALLSFSGSFIMSPYVSPRWHRIETANAVGVDQIGYGDVISGTGPFAFDNYTVGVELNLTRYDNYWQGAAQIEKIIFSIIPDPDARNTALLTGDIHILTSPHPAYYDDMKADPDIEFVEAGGGTITQCLGMNNKVINKTWRQAISYTIDYDYMIEELREGYSVRLGSPVPLGIAYANYSFNYATYNLTRARGYMQSMGFGVGFTTDVQWTTQAATAPFRSFNYTYDIGNIFREDMLPFLQDNLAQIGCAVTDNGQEWTPYLDLVYNRTAPGYDGLELWFLGWIPDYNDPSNYLNPLMSNVSSGNAARVGYDDYFAFTGYKNHYLEDLLRAGLAETDPEARKWIYWEIQRYCVEDLMPLVWGYTSLNADAWTYGLLEFPSNALDFNYFYPCRWGIFNISLSLLTPSNIVYYKGDTGNNITLTITAQDMLDPMYYVYRNTSLISNNSWVSGVPVVINVDNLAAGSYLYRIEVHNGGEVAEVYVSVTVIDYSIIISHPSDVSYIEGSPGNTITWLITAANMLDPMYYVYRNTSLISNNSWVSGVPVVINIDNLAAGSYLYRIEVHNGGELAEDSVIVSVSTPPGVIPGFPLGFMVIISTFTIFIIRKKLINK